MTYVIRDAQRRLSEVVAAAVLAVSILGATPAATAQPPARAGVLRVTGDLAPQRYGDVIAVGLDGRAIDLSGSPYPETDPLVSPDGQLVAYFSQRSAGEYDGAEYAYLVRLDGTGRKRISRRLDVYPDKNDPWLDWSPTSRRITVETVEGTTLLTSSGRRIWRGPSSDYCTTGSQWSATGRLALDQCEDDHLVLSSDHRIRIISSTGRQVATFPGDRFAWSADGRRIAYISNGVLFVRDGGGAGQVRLRRILPASQCGWDMRWATPTRIGISYYTDFICSTERAVMVDEMTGASWAVRPSQVDAICPAPGACTHERGGERRAVTPSGHTTAWFDAHSVLHVQRAGAAARQIASIPDCSGGGDGLWFANHGRALVYVSACYEPPLRAFTVPAGGGGVPQQLFLGDDAMTNLVWSADGTRIAYVAQGGIWTMAVDGTGRRRLTTERSGYDECPSWSPDGAAIVYLHTSADTYPPTELGIVTSDGRTVRRLAVLGLIRDLSCPVWGPTLIAVPVYHGIATVAPNGASDRLAVHLGAVDGSALGWLADGTLAYALWPTFEAPTRVELHIRGSTTTVTLPLEVADVAFAPDGTALAVLGQHDNDTWYEVWTVATNGTDPVQVTNELGARSAAWG